MGPTVAGARRKSSGELRESQSLPEFAALSTQIYDERGRGATTDDFYRITTRSLSGGAPPPRSTPHTNMPRGYQVMVARINSTRKRRWSRCTQQQRFQYNIQEERRRRKGPGMASWMVALAAAILTGGKVSVHGCYIHGSDIGYCEPSLYEDSEFR